MTEQLPDEAYAIAVALFPDIGPARLREVMSQGPAQRAWEKLANPTPQARAAVAKLWQRHCDLGITVLLPDSCWYPERLRETPEAPAVLFCRGDPRALSGRPTAALVGTQAPTRYGIGVAAQLGAELSDVGVSVVSGLALGIDGAAHEGACGAGAPPIGVVAGGVDLAYPRRHTRLWERVMEHGVIVSESPAGAKTEKWRFPVRNRLLAALERCGRRGREPARWRFEAHRQRRHCPRDRSGRSARLDTECDIRRTQRDVVRRRVSGP